LWIIRVAPRAAWRRFLDKPKRFGRIGGEPKSAFGTRRDIVIAGRLVLVPVVFANRAVFSVNLIRRVLRKMLPLLPPYDSSALEFGISVSGDSMKPIDDRPRAADERMFYDDARHTGGERDARQQAKERQDQSHAALESWIAAAIAELAVER
jgi:hypothetical protein